VADDEVVIGAPADGVRLLTLTRPERRNAWTLAMEAQYFAALATAAADPDVRAVVVTGAGDHFCPGFDPERLGESAGGVLVELRDRPSIGSIRHFPKPMIAAVNGSCAGIGLAHALLCDVRFVAEEARISTAFVRRGLAGERAVTWMLPRLVGTERALDLLLSGRTISGSEAHQLGLASRLMPRAEVVSGAVAYAAEIARRCSPTALAAMRAQLYGDLGRSFDEASAISDAIVVSMSAGRDLGLSVQAASAGSRPQFPPLPAGFDADGWIDEAMQAYPNAAEWPG
jgi:enoyl-CoA hydratase/carnithine racemase